MSFFFLKIRGVNFFKNGMYLDHFLKILIKNFVYNFFIYTAYFFAEKYLIEFNTRYLFNYTVALFNNVTLFFSSDRIHFYIILALLNVITLI